jgi:glycosyltransferase involved in cell wall biosynthesis
MIMIAPVSVIIPCYNSESTLERAVMSVYGQTLKPAELIIVDDCSSDGTKNLNLELQNRLGEGWIRIVLNETNVGVSSSRNRGWNLAGQPYIAFLDSDDFWHSRKIEIQYGYMKNNPEKMITGHGFEILRGGGAEKSVDGSLEVKQRTIRQLILKNYFITPGIMLKRDIPERFQEGRNYMEDHLLLIELCFKYGPIDEIQLPLAYLGKASIGEGGLASNLLQMEKGELHNYWYLLSEGKISFLFALALSLFSIAKFVRRVIMVKILKIKIGVPTLVHF